MTGHNLELDIYNEELKIAIEYNGEQHYKYCPVFHKDKMAYYKSLARDVDKKEWCDLNSITLKVLKYNEVEKWKSILLSER